MSLNAIEDFIEQNPDTHLKSISIHCFNPRNISEIDELAEWGIYREAVNAGAPVSPS